MKAIRAISHQFAQCQTAIIWLEWLHRKLSIFFFAEFVGLRLAGRRDPGCLQRMIHFVF
jgi:heme A synthase